MKLRLPKVPRGVRNTLLAVLILLLFVVVGGAAYTYFLGPDASQEIAATPPPPPPPPAVIKPSKPAANIPASASVQTLSSPVAPGENASITVRTVPTASCTIEVIYDKLKSTDSGLVKRTADDYGMVTWAWTVDPNAPSGTWPVNVTCAYNGKTAFVRGDLEVKAAGAAPAQQQ